MTASPTTRPASIRREWKGERGLPVFVAQHGNGYRSRQSLGHLLLEAADVSGGISRDQFALFRSLRVFAESGREWLDRDAIREELGYQAWDDARPRLLDWLLVEEETAPEGINHSYRVNPVVTMQLAPALNQLLEEWKPVGRRAWSGESLRFARGGADAEELEAREVAARLFDRAGTRLAEKSRNILWMALRRLVEREGVELEVSKGSPSAAAALEPLRYYALAVDGSEEGKWRWNADAPRQSFAASIEFLAPFAGTERAGGA